MADYPTLAELEFFEAGGACGDSQEAASRSRGGEAVTIDEIIERNVSQHKCAECEHGQRLDSEWGPCCREACRRAVKEALEMAAQGFATWNLSRGLAADRAWPSPDEVAASLRALAATLEEKP